jgi:threonine dehydrogenase-like Zn-dependent dehydrogenase
MLALQFNDQQLRLNDVQKPEMPGEAVVRVTRAGICATDVAITAGYAGFQGTLGHEFVGVVESSPEPEWVGKRVVGDINVGCGVCDDCLRDGHHCEARDVLGIVRRNGAFAEYLSLPVRNLRIVPDSVTDREAVFAEPLAAACRILDQVRISRNQEVVVFGDGKLGQLIAQVLLADGLRPVLVGRHLDKLAVAESVGIAVCRIEEFENDPKSRQSADVVVEATGQAAGFGAAMRTVRPRGTVVLKSTFHGEWKMRAEDLVVPEITIVGSRCGSMDAALDLLERRAVVLDPLVSAEYPLDAGIAAFEKATTRGTLKVQLVMNAESRMRNAE